MFATVSYHLPNLAFHTDVCSPLIFAGFIHRKWLQITSTLGILDSKCQLFLAEPFWRIITNPVDVQLRAWGSSLSARLYVQCSVEKIENGSFRVNTCDNKLPKSLVGILTQAHEKTQGETLRTECKKKTWKPCWGSKSNLGTSSKSPPESKDSWQSQPRNLISAVNLNTREGAKASPIRLWCWKLH